jgi:hypothetical protein
MTNEQLRAALADGRVHTAVDLAPRFGVTCREIRHRAGELRAALAGRPVDEVWTSDGAGFQLRERRRRPRVPA